MKTNTRIRISEYSQSERKRVLDILLSLFLLFVSVPGLLVFSCLILASAGWPILFTQKRLGKNKRIFTLYKFRTMRAGAEAERDSLKKENIAPAPMFKVPQDPRFSPFGYFLSRTGIDELPQLVNVLKNDMSLVGPRPLPVTEGNALGANWGWRWQVKPGLFSYWVLSSDRYRSLEKWRQLELRTIRIKSLKGDIVVIIRVLHQQMLFLLRYLPNIFQ